MIKLNRDLNTLPVSWIGWIVYFLMPLKKSRAKKNIERVFQSSISTKEKKRLAASYYSHMMMSIKEIMLYSFMSKKRLAKRISIIGVDYLNNAMNMKKGVLIFTGHFGNWEYVPRFFPDKVNNDNYRYSCIRKPLRFKFLDQIFLRPFEFAGFHIIYKKNAIRQICKALKKQGIVFLPFDLRPALHAKDKVVTDFLGQQTSTYTSLAYLAELFRVPVLSISFYRINKKQHVIEFHPEVDWQPNEDKQQAILNNTKNYNKQLEEIVLRHPEQWLWSYKRW